MEAARGALAFALVLGVILAPVATPFPMGSVPLAGHVPPAALPAVGVPVGPDHPVDLAFVLQDGVDPSAMRAWLASRELTPQPTRDPAILRVVTDAASVRAALGVDLRAFPGLVAPDRDPVLPRALAGDVLAIVGLSSPIVSTMQGAAEGAPPFVPAELHAAYSVDALHAAGFDGRGVRVAITSWGPADPVALSEFAGAYGLPGAKLIHHAEGGGASCSGPRHPEWDLDVQVVHAMAPGAELHVYCARAATLASLLVVLSELVADDAVDVVSQSWGACEARVDAATARAFESRLAAASARGIAFFSASGDGGSRECTRWLPSDERVATSFPGTVPLTVAVGGTRLVMDGLVRSDETAWNTCAPCPELAWAASGGGVSIHHARPYWQPGSGGRLSADVAAVADRASGVSVRHDGAWLQMGGTSVATPLWAGVWALAVHEQGRIASAAPLLWTLGGSSGSYHDVVGGHNGDFAAGAGHDLPTGWGTPRADALLAALRALPRAPGAVATAGPGVGEITLRWDAPSSGEPAAFVVLRGEVAGNEAPIATLDGGARSFLDAGLAGGSTWSYRVVAREEGRDGFPSSPVAARTFAAPDAPRDVLAAPVPDPTRATIFWQAPEDDGGDPIHAYRVWRRVHGGEDVLARVVDGGARSVVDDGCRVASLCFYRVEAVNRVGVGPASAEAPIAGAG